MKNLGTLTLETERLVIRKFNENDGVYMYSNWAGDDNVTRYMKWPTHKAKGMSKSYVNWIVKSYEKDDENTVYEWVIELKEIGQPIGSIGVVDINTDIESVQIGYCIGAKWWHQGIMTEAFKEVIRFFMEDVGVSRIEARYDTRNINSGRVMERCGLKYEGILRSSDINNSGVFDAAWYSILKEDYFKQ
ncbi:GNAT family N-acetyltransferase [uncultured Clostridium sp.]|uniref:GNAT family N-acetyltransferase n=1 Tax=uncultured Clostridium sp. TaxID=59620 RepID=UPI0025D049AD|nr:GNAT family N-acetyltransferase [uncultured Clostridium sp.]